MLPAELRIKIWQVTLPGPRTIYTTRGSSNTPFVANRDIATALLHVNSESRQIAVKVYPICFSQLSGLEQVRFNYQSDSLAFQTTVVWDTTLTEDDIYDKQVRENLKVVQHVILDFAPTRQEWVKFFIAQASTMDNLKSITSQKSKNNDQFMSTGLDLYKRSQKLLEEERTAHPYLPKLSSKPPAFKELTMEEMGIFRELQRGEASHRR
jgi:hypothetical protein